jgi:hypothetical protein
MTPEDRLPSFSRTGWESRFRAVPSWRETGPDVLVWLVGVAGFEPTASSSRTKRATKLRYTPSGAELS